MLLQTQVTIQDNTQMFCSWPLCGKWPGPMGWICFEMCSGPMMRTFVLSNILFWKHSCKRQEQYFSETLLRYLNTSSTLLLFYPQTTLSQCPIRECVCVGWCNEVETVVHYFLSWWAPRSSLPTAGREAEDEAPTRREYQTHADTFSLCVSVAFTHTLTQ